MEDKIYIEMIKSALHDNKYNYHRANDNKFFHESRISVDTVDLPISVITIKKLESGNCHTIATIEHFNGT